MIRLGGRASDGRSGKAGAFVLALYLAATCLAQFAHDHHQGLPVAGPGCGDPGTQWTDHSDTIDLSAPAESCPACQVKTAEAVAVGSLPLPMVRAVRPLAIAETPPTASRRSPDHTVRGPPLA